MSLLPLHIENQPAEADLEYLENKINAHNMAATGVPFGGRLACFARDATGQMVAGISGYTWGDCCKIEFLWVHENSRGQRMGTRLLEAAEAEALRRGCRQMVLDSYSFQAPDFYRKKGYVDIGTVEGFPAGHQQYYFTKALK
jgi:GNAT superfamily N-acetyltransferase